MSVVHSGFMHSHGPRTETKYSLGYSGVHRVHYQMAFAPTIMCQDKSNKESPSGQRLSSYWESGRGEAAGKGNEGTLFKLAVTHSWLFSIRVNHSWPRPFSGALWKHSSLIEWIGIKNKNGRQNPILKTSQIEARCHVEQWHNTINALVGWGQRMKKK